jgi:serine protease
MFRSTRFTLASAVVLASVVTACSSEVAPSRLSAPPQRSSDLVADQPSQYIIDFRLGVPADFSERVAALGGKVEYLHSDAGIAVVSGVSGASAASLGGAGDNVEGDVTISVAPAASRTEEAPAIGIESQSAPNTAVLFARQWDMLAIGADKAWASGRLGATGVTVAILDTGLDYDNRDLTGLVDLSRSVSLVASDDSILKKNFGTTRHPIDDLNGHGTNVGSTVSSKAFAFAGVTSRTTLIGVKVLGASGGGSLGTILAGLLWAADHGADVANLSLGGAFSRSHGAGRVASIVDKVFKYANRKGTLVVVAAGNALPGQLPVDIHHTADVFNTFCDASWVICVSATGPTSAAGTNGPWANVDAIADYSNYGKNEITVAGPGGTGAGFVWSFCARHLLVRQNNADVFPCASGNVILGFAGTSQATPHVSGLAALLVAELGHGIPNNIADVIKTTSDDLGKKGHDEFYGAGRINVAKAFGM